MEEGEREPKIGTSEAVLIGVAVLVLDIIDLIPIAGDITDIPSLGVNWYLKNKGISGTPFVIAEVLDLIPVIQEFPSRSIAWWITVGIDHFGSKSLNEKLEKVGEEMEGQEGAGATTGTAGAVGGNATTSTSVGGSALGGTTTTTTASMGTQEEGFSSTATTTTGGKGETSTTEDVGKKPSERETPDGRPDKNDREDGAAAENRDEREERRRETAEEVEKTEEQRDFGRDGMAGVEGENDPDKVTKRLAAEFAAKDEQDRKDAPPPPS